mgnify:CR=1 FL=1
MMIGQVCVLLMLRGVGLRTGRCAKIIGLTLQLPKTTPAIQALRAASLVRTSSSHGCRMTVAAATAGAVSPAPAAASVAEQNQAVVRGLQPAPVFAFFAELACIPRPPKQEQK